jgi:hypothetical protein
VYPVAVGFPWASTPVVLTVSPCPDVLYVRVRFFGMAVRLYFDFATSSVQVPIARSVACAVSAAAGARVASTDPNASVRKSDGITFLLGWA